MKYKYKIWEKHFWITIYIFIKAYPNKANKIIKKKYYQFFINLPEYVPNESIKKQLTYLINKYSVVPYLDTKQNMLRWVNFIHNKLSKNYGIKPMSLKERETHINTLLNPPIKKKVKTMLPINKKNVCNVIILLLTIYIVLTFI
jgi:hypothetical protein